ncbi:MAG: tRNA (adenosine(37)-N6)-threonylcarbamoyltransferase complex dimerization subunit type 1 TsaB [Rhodobacterales bacterium]|nr:tRNA (adenosine(37)-N6)-threonylcarbamoyltransferase complex dimerization subunit type 1 TsaB [Rhodobacterales bacterium]
MPPDGPVLGFDTAAAHCAAAIVWGDRVLARAEEPMDRGQAERLMPLLQEVLAAAGLGWRDLALVAVGTGPGNFTGVRLAVAAARGLALALRVPAVGVTGFQARAWGQPAGVLTAIDARRGSLWLAAEGHLPPQLWEGGDLPPAVQSLDVTGAQADRLAALTGGRVLAEQAPLAVALARVAAGRAGVPQPRPAPLYLRAADALPPADPPPVILP